MSATIKDIKEETGLSLATISKYLNGGKVLDKNAQLIRAAVKKLHYQPNEMARSLVTNKTRTVGVVCYSVASLFAGIMLKYVGDFLRSKGYGVLICDSDNKEELQEENIRFMLNKKVDGIIIIPVSTIYVYKFYKIFIREDSMELDLMSKIAIEQDAIIDESIGNMFDGSLKYLYGYIFSFCMNSTIADEVLADVLYKASSEIKKFHHSTTVFVWLCQMAKKELNSPHYRKRYVPPEESEYLSYNLHVGNASNENLGSALSKLNSTYKDVFYMCVLGKLPYKVIAEIYGRPEEWVYDTYLSAKNRIVNLTE